MKITLKEFVDKLQICDEYIFPIASACCDSTTKSKKFLSPYKLFEDYHEVQDFHKLLFGNKDIKKSMWSLRDIEKANLCQGILEDIGTHVFNAMAQSVINITPATIKKFAKIMGYTKAVLVRTVLVDAVSRFIDLQDLADHLEIKTGRSLYSLPNNICERNYKEVCEILIRTFELMCTEQKQSLQKRISRTAAEGMYKGSTFTF